ncbi:hypothetical protein ACFL22_01180 [Patescibacteria group bacterium]
MEIKTTTWEEHGETFEKVALGVKKYVDEKGLQVDAIVPIFRGAGFLATYLAYRLSVLRILPVQYKYFFPKKGTAELHQLLFTPSKEILGDSPTLVLVEGDYCYGGTTTQACKDLKEEFPNCKIIFATDLADYTYRDVVKDYVETMVVGRYTNHCEELSEEECEKLGIQSISRAVWEQASEEEAIPKCEQYQYIDLEKVKSKSKKKFEMEF